MPESQLTNLQQVALAILAQNMMWTPGPEYGYTLPKDITYGTAAYKKWVDRARIDWAYHQAFLFLEIGEEDFTNV